VLRHGGPAVLRDDDARDARLPADLRAALREWSEVAESVLRAGDEHQVDLLRRRGRQLASRAAGVLGRPVEFVDPVSGTVEPIDGTSAGPASNGAASNGAAANGAASTGAASTGAAATGAAATGSGSTGASSTGAVLSGPARGVASNGAGTAHLAEAGPSRLVDGSRSARPVLAPEPPGPTPWGTGMVVATFFAVLVAIADVVLARAFASAFGLLWVPANLLVTAGTVPSLWLARDVPFWRWPACGAAAGLGAAWVVMLLGLLAS
jgi:hypothetical protein